jgi:hypothetical protein
MAVGHARLAWDAAPGRIDVALVLSELYALRGEDRSAARILRQAMSMNPGSDARLGEALIGLGE